MWVEIARLAQTTTQAIIIQIEEMVKNCRHTKKIENNENNIIVQILKIWWEINQQNFTQRSYKKSSLHLYRPTRLSGIGCSKSFQLSVGGFF